MSRRILVAFLLLAASVTASAGTGKIIIVNVDAPGVGLNDLTPAQPAGGNPGTTLGQQRLNVYEKAAARWTTMLDTNVDILVEASFASLPCDDDGIVLGQAGPKSVRRDFANAPLPGVWYPIALANKFAGNDLSVGLADVAMTFNSALDTASCGGDVELVLRLRRQRRHPLRLLRGGVARAGARSRLRRRHARARLPRQPPLGLRRAHLRPLGRAALGPDVRAAA